MVDLFLVDVSDTFADDDGDDVTITVDGLPDWLSFNDDTNTISGIPFFEDITNSPISIDVTASDGEETVTDTFEVTVGDPTPVTTTTINSNEQFFFFRRFYTRGTSASEEINGSSIRDVIFSLARNDLVVGNEGSDVIWTGFGKDFFTGNEGNDIIVGENSDDILFGNEGRNRLFGGDDNDFLDGGEDKDILLGGNNNDILIGGSGNNKLLGGRGDDVFVLDNQGFNQIFDYEDGSDKFLLGSDTKSDLHSILIKLY